MAEKKTVLLIGGGAVGAIGALNLEVGGLAEVTLVLRGNYNVVTEKGYQIESCDHGKLEGWRPSHVVKGVPELKDGDKPWDYIVLVTKNVPDIGPTVQDLVAPALRKDNSHTAIVLIQNGLNIEKPLHATYPSTPVLSGVSMIGSTEPTAGIIEHDDHDRLLVGAFPHPNLDSKVGEEKSNEFVQIYGNGKKTQVSHSPNVLYDRWRKLVYNACLNPICAITGLDNGRLRLADGAVEGLIRPAMKEIVAAANAVGVKLEGEAVDYMIEVDPLELYISPSMLADVRKGNYIECENLLGEPLREGRKAGVSMPTMEVLFSLCKALQWRTKEQRGLVTIPPKRGS